MFRISDPNEAVSARSHSSRREQHSRVKLLGGVIHPPKLGYSYMVNANKAANCQRGLLGWGGVKEDSITT